MPSHTLLQHHQVGVFAIDQDGYAAGIVVGRVGLLLMSRLSEQQMQFQLSGGWFSAEELWLLPVTLFIGLIAAVIPAIQAYRTDISQVLRNE